jgi:hypothetical protein
VFGLISRGQQTVTAIDQPIAWSRIHLESDVFSWCCSVSHDPFLNKFLK